MKPIRASEIGSYLYCRRAWLYRHQGLESTNHAEMAAGTALHHQHGRNVLVAGFFRNAAWFLLVAALVLGVIFATQYLLLGMK